MSEDMMASSHARRAHIGAVEMGGAPGDLFDASLMPPSHTHTNSFYSDSQPFPSSHFNTDSFTPPGDAFFTGYQAYQAPSVSRPPASIPLTSITPVYLQQQSQQSHQSHQSPQAQQPQQQQTCYDSPHDYAPWYGVSPAMYGLRTEPPTLPSSRLSASIVATDSVPERREQEEYGSQDGSTALDGKLLGFLSSTTAAHVVDGVGRVVEVDMAAELYGMFFVAEHVFADDGADTSERQQPPRRQELTCYRRNLWQVSGEITVPRQVTHIASHGQHIPVLELAASIHATDSIEGKPVEIITTPWKGVTGSSHGQPAAPHQVTLDLESAGGAGGAGREVDDGSRVSLPVTWKRLQFKHATANNGRRKGMQQRYHVHVSLLARVQSGEWVSIADVRSGPIVVRGRSPRNFDARGEVPLGTVSFNERRGTNRSDVSVDSSQINGPPVLKVEDEDAGTVSEYLSAPTGLALDQSLLSGPHQQQNINTTRSKSRSKRNAPTQGSRPQECESVPDSGAKRPRSRQASPHGTRLSQTPRTEQHVSLTTLDLNLFDDDRASVGSPESNHASPVASRGTPHSDKSYMAASAPGLMGRSPSSDDDDQLYEYFPLGVDDWMMPVDAVYRPHFVHTTRTGVGRALPIQGGRGRIKAYFID